MSTLEKTITILHTLPERQVEQIYSYALFVSIQNPAGNQSDNSERAERRRRLLRSKKYVHKSYRSAKEIDRSIQEMRSNDRV